MRAAFSFSGATRHGLVALAEGLVVAGIIAALLFALSPIYAPARLIGGTEQTYAAKGGNGNGNGGGNGNGNGNGNTVVSGAAWVSASPNPAAAGGERVFVEGCGYDVAPVEVHIVHSAGGTEAYGVGMWASGCMSFTFLTQEAGTYTIEVYQASGSSGNPSTSFVASTTLAVN